MADHIVDVADGFWNIRGSFKIAKVINIGTQASLVRLNSGRFVLLDSYALEGPIADRVMALTEGGEKLDAIINLHPFHTVFVKRVAAMFPNAKLYGTSRHHEKAPDLGWQPELTETEAFAALFADDFDFMVPRGVHFVPDDPSLHFASVLAFHRASHTLHVDDTLNWIPVPFASGLAFHPTLGKVLEDRADAAADFRTWAGELAQRCENVLHVCTAHTRMAPVSDDPPGGIALRVRKALQKVEKTLKKHEARF